MSKIIGFAGRMQSGKTSAGNYLIGLEMCSLGLLNDFKLDENGELIVPVDNGKEIVEGVFRATYLPENEEGIEYLINNVWPYIKVYNFADSLKRLCIEIFGCSYESMYDNKDELTAIKWIDIKKACNGNLNFKKNMNEFLTGRELLEVVGTDIFRTIQPSC
ncbi:MAG: hypothetical protein AABY22_09460, partial [Nanoarchaeota archaeon]